MKKLIYVLVLGIAVGIFAMEIVYTARVKKVESYDVLYKVKINTEFINVRTQPTTQAEKIYEVVRSEVYEVIEEYEDSYHWYKIIYSDRKVGWVASDKTEKWVIKLEDK